jgi:hypothetical protein
MKKSTPANQSRAIPKGVNFFSRRILSEDNFLAGVDLFFHARNHLVDCLKFVFCAPVDDQLHYKSMSDVQLDLTKYWLMQWQFAALLSIGGWLAQHYSRWKFEREKQKFRSVTFRIEYGFCFRYLCKHLGLIPGNNKIALYFFLYLIVLLCNFIWSYETQTVGPYQ